MSVMKLLSSSKKQSSSASAPQPQQQRGQQRSSSASLRRRSSQASQQKQRSSQSSRRSSSGSQNPTERRRSSLMSRVRKAPLSVDFLVAKRRWAELSEVLKTERGREDVVANYELEVDCGRAAESTFLHEACRHGAPLAFVKALYQVVPEAVAVRDSKGRTPLHCAAIASACPITEVGSDVVSYLLELDSKASGGHAVATGDDEGRLPLHLAAGAVRDCDDEDSNECLFIDTDALSPPESDVIRQLMAVHPYSANIDDNDGCSGLEYAILSGVDVKTVRRMRKTSEAVWKKEQQRGAERRLEQMRKAKELTERVQAQVEEQRRPSLAQMSSRRKAVKRGAMAA